MAKAARVEAERESVAEAHARLDEVIDRIASGESVDDSEVLNARNALVAAELTVDAHDQARVRRTERERLQRIETIRVELQRQTSAELASVLDAHRLAVDALVELRAAGDKYAAGLAARGRELKRLGVNRRGSGDGMSVSEGSLRVEGVRWFFGSNQGLLGDRLVADAAFFASSRPNLKIRGEASRTGLEGQMPSQQLARTVEQLGAGAENQVG